LEQYLKTIVILLLAGNLLAAFFLMPAKSDRASVGASDIVAGSSLALLSEAKSKLESSMVEKIDSPNRVEEASLINGMISNDTVSERKANEAKKRELGLSLTPLSTSTPFLKQNTDPVCMMVQGIKTVDIANRLKTKLLSLTATNLIVAASDLFSDQYWVHLGPYKTEQDAINANVRLRETSRIGYVFTNDQEENSISLGVFNSSANAQRLQASLNKEGYSSKVWNRKLVLYDLTADISSNTAAILAFIANEGYIPAACK
jgi:hypothetical protein